MSLEQQGPSPERIRMKEQKTTCLAPQGLGFGEGAISYRDRAVSEISMHELEQVENLIRSPEQILVEVDKQDGKYLDDDGCGDGRGVTDENGNVVEVVKDGVELKKSLNRAKVFGGGATMATATLIGLGDARGQDLQSLFRSGIEVMNESGIDYGAHNDDHAEPGGKNSGCGAIDKAPVIIKNAKQYRNEIEQTILALDPTVNTQNLNEVLDSYDNYADSLPEPEETAYQGAVVMDDIKKDHKVVKKLLKGHSEMYIVLNDIEGCTVDQHVVRSESEESIQVFAVDTWRIASIANRLYEYDNEDIKQKAVLSQLVYTLATAATLTDGTLPVYRIKDAQKPESVYNKIL